MASVSKIKVWGISIGYKIKLSHKEVERIADTTSAVGVILAPFGLSTVMIGIVVAAAYLFKAVCAIGGHDGVIVKYYFGTGGIATVWPR